MDFTIPFIIATVCFIALIVVFFKYRRMSLREKHNLIKRANEYEDKYNARNEEAEMLRVEINDLIKDNDVLSDSLEYRRKENKKLCDDYNRALKHIREAKEALDNMKRKDTNLTLAREALEDIPEIASDKKKD